MGTVRMAMISPTRMMRDVPPDSSGWEAYRFAFLNTLLPMLLAALPAIAVMLGVALISSSRGFSLFIPIVLAIEFAVIGVILLLAPLFGRWRRTSYCV